MVEIAKPTGTTRVAAVIGSPIRHSLSPVIHNAAFRELDLDWVYVAFEVAAADVPRALDGMRVFGIDGLSVTMPLKDAVAAAVDELSAPARILGAVNCVVRDGDRLIGHNTDGDGFLAGLAQSCGFDPAGHRCVVVGAGGAARAIIHALGAAGAAEVLVVNRTAAKAESAAVLAGNAGRAGDETDIAGMDLVVNATSVGMGADGDADGPVPFALDYLHEGQVVVDIITKPVQTPLLRAATARGAVAVDGLAMLVNQAALAFEIWTGQPAPIAVMTAVIRGELV